MSLTALSGGGGSTDYVNAGLTVDSLGNVMMVGYTKSFPSVNNGRSWVIKTDSIGNVKWHRTYNGIGSSAANGIRAGKLNDGTIIISGGKNGNGYLQKIDTAGNELWINLYDVQGSQGLWGVVGLENGTIVSCGVTDGPSGTQAGWLIKTDANGDTLWTRTYDSSADFIDYLRNMIVLPNGDIVMVGFGHGTSSTTQDGWILRVDSMGCLIEGCHTVGLNDELRTENEELKVWPNPANDVVHIGVQGSKFKVSEVSVIDRLGRLSSPPWEEGSGEVIKLNTSTLPNGIYLITITDENNWTCYI